MALPRATDRPIRESEAVELLERYLGHGRPSVQNTKLSLGIGDDAAILARPRAELCWSIDSSEEGLHFQMSWMKPGDIAHKSFHAALSDLAAMGAHPIAALSHVTLSPAVDRGFFKAFVRAQERLGSATGCPIVGGNLSFGARFGVVTTVLGEHSTKSKSRPLLTRSSAKAGDELWLMGEVGWARLGLALLERGSRDRSRAASKALRAFRNPEARVSAGKALLGRASACLDVSDGLVRDAGRLSKASQVQVTIDADLLLQTLSAPFTELAHRLKVDPLEVALLGGEDYALLASGRAARRPPGCQVIGQIEPGAGLVLRKNGKLSPLQGGFEHGPAQSNASARKKAPPSIARERAKNRR